MSVGLVTIALWIGMTAFGAVVSLVNLWDARGDLEYQIGRPERRWERLLIARWDVAFEILRLVAFVLMFVAGVLIAWVQFNPDPPPASLYVRGVLLFVIANLLTQSLGKRWLRHRLTKPRPKL